MPDAADYFIAKGKVASCYESDERYKGNNRTCLVCKKKHLSYPDTCNDGWKTLRGELVYPNDCINFEK